MPNLDPWMKQNSNKNEKESTTTTTTMNKLENHLLSVRAQNQKKINLTVNLYI